MVRSGKTPDQDYMEHFCNRSKENCLPAIENIEWTDCLPNKAPLICYLAKDMGELANGYSLPSKPHIDLLKSRVSLDAHTHHTVEMKEITIRESSDEEVRMFHTWVWQNHNADDEKFPTGLLSLDVEELKIRTEDYEELLKVQRDLRDEKTGEVDLEIFIPSYYAKNCHQLIAKIIIGNGITWFGSIRFPWRMVESKGKLKYMLHVVNLKATSPIIKLIDNIGDYITGQGIINDRNGIQDEIYNIYGIMVKLPIPVEMDAISALAGWNFPKSDMFTTNLICNGGLLNKVISCADGKWCLPLEDLPAPFKAYLIGDVRYGYITSNILLAIIIQDLFPDPEVCCNLLELDQKDWIKYVLSMITSLLAEQSINPAVKKTALTRQDLLLSLRGWDNSGPKRTMMKFPDEGLLKLAKLIPDWPTIVHGGPRFLHIVRQKFCEQYPVLKSIDFKHLVIKPRFDKEVDQNFQKIVLFQRPLLTDISVLPGTNNQGLCCWPDYEATVFQMDLNNMSTQKLFEEAKRIGRNVQESVLEAVRLCPVRFMEISEAIDELDLDLYENRFWKKAAFYDRLRLCSFRACGLEFRRSTQMEDLIQKKQNFVVSEQLSAKSGPYREHHKDLCSVLANRNSGSSAQTPRTSIQSEIFKETKGPNYWRNKARKEQLKRAKHEQNRKDEVTAPAAKFDLRSKLSNRNSGSISHASRTQSFGVTPFHHGGEYSTGTSKDIVSDATRAFREPRTPPRRSSSDKAATVTSGAYEASTPSSTRQDNDDVFKALTQSGSGSRNPVPYSAKKKPTKKKKTETGYDLQIHLSPKPDGYFDDTEDDSDWETDLAFRAVRESGLKFRRQ